MSTTSAKPATTPMPVQLPASEFWQFILPHLSTPQRGPKCQLGSHRVCNLIVWGLYPGRQWTGLPVPTDGHDKPTIHDTTGYNVFATWADDGSLEEACIASVQPLADQNQLARSLLQGDGTNTVATKGGEGLGSSGYNHHKGETVLAIIANHGYVWAPLPVAPVNAAETVLLPEGLQALRRVAKLPGWRLQGAYLHLDGGFDARHTRKAIFKAGMMPHLTENPRNRQTPKRGRKRRCNDAMHALRERVERTFAWEDQCKRLLLRFADHQRRHSGLQLMAYTLINLRHFCTT